MMTKIGEIKKLSGYYNADSARLYVENNLLLMHVSGFAGPVNLGIGLARVVIGAKPYTSGTKVLAKASLAALAGHTWKQGSGAWSGFYGGLASSVDTRGKRTIVTVHLRSGKSFSGETSEDVAEYLVSGSPQMSDEDLAEYQLQQDRLRRYVADAEQTIPEVESIIANLKGEIDRLQTMSISSATFDERDSAKERLEESISELAENETLLSILKDRIRINKDFGSIEAYEAKRKELSENVETISQKKGFKWKTMSLGFVCIVTSFVPEYSEATRSILGPIGYVMFFYPILHLLMAPRRRKKSKALIQKLEELKQYRTL